MVNSAYKNILDSYVDRKKLKWRGMFVSEHTAAVVKEKAEHEYVWARKEYMTDEEIGKVLLDAMRRGISVAIQKEECDLNGLYSPDITGLVMGFDDQYVYIGDSKIEIENIRNAEFLDLKKWSNL